jgi:uncharacterized protein (TIGR02757 family)
MTFLELKDFLDEKADFYNNSSFIQDDPISIPHRFSLQQDIEIVGFLTTTISWGNRKSIINDAEKMLNFMENSPFDFVKNVSQNELKSLENVSIHGTFMGEDFREFILNLKRIYEENDTLENLFLVRNEEHNFYHALHRFREEFTGLTSHRSKKHVSSTYKNSSAKRLIMFLRWMVRKDKKGVDFGIWYQIDQRHLSIPLDVHTCKVSQGY